MRKPYLFVDFDNTLMATESLVLPSLVERFNILYGDLIPTRLTVELFLHHFHGKARENLCQALSNFFSICVDYETLYDNRESDVVNSLKKNGVEMAPGAIEALCALQKTYDLALVTNSPLQRVFSAMRYATNGRGAELAACFGTNFFEAFVRAKPDPWVYLSALQLVDTPAETSFAIEDSGTGVAASTGAGIRTLGFLGFTDTKAASEKDLCHRGALKCFDGWSDIVNFMNTL